MGLYVEVMCDEHKDWPNTPEYAGNINHRCTSDRGDNPQGHTVAEARADARNQGWLIKGSRSVCPDCRKTLPGEQS